MFVNWNPGFTSRPVKPADLLNFPSELPRFKFYLFHLFPLAAFWQLGWDEEINQSKNCSACDNTEMQYIVLLLWAALYSMGQHCTALQ